MSPRPTIARALAAAIATGLLIAGCTNNDAPPPPGITGSFPVGTSALPPPRLGPDTIPTTVPRSPGSTPGSTPSSLPPAVNGPAR